MSMKAVVFQQGGTADVLSHTDVQRPVPGAHEALIEVHACGINRIDLDLRAEIDEEMPMPHVLGADIAGVVVEYGDGAADPAVGSRVVVSPAIPVAGTNRCRIIGYQTQGGYAEYAVVPAANLVPLPDSLSFQDAAALPLSGMTAHHALFDHGRLRAGDRVLITGGTGGVGNLAVQMALAAGCQVVSTAGSADHIAWLKDLGVPLVVDHSTDNFGDEVVAHGPYDVIFDHIGGTVLASCIPAVAEDGRIVAIGYTAGDKVTFSLFELFRSQASISGSYMGDMANLKAVFQMAASGRIRPIIGKVFPLQQTAAAHRLLESRKFIGKIVLAVR